MAANVASAVGPLPSDSLDGRRAAKAGADFRGKCCLPFLAIDGAEDGLMD